MDLGDTLGILNVVVYWRIWPYVVVVETSFMPYSIVILLLINAA